MRLVAALVILTLLAACDRPPPPKPVVVVSVLPQAYFVERVAGDLVEVHVMIPPGASPATHAPTQAQLQAASDASVYVKVGHPSFPFERAWLDRLIGESTLVVDGSAGLARRDGDPHVWVSPSCARTMAINIEAALSGVLPEHDDALQANLDAFLVDIEQLDAEIRFLLDPVEGESFFVYHPAWGYFADEYGLVQKAMEQGNKPPSPAAMIEFIIEAKESGAKVILVQPQFTAERAKLVADEVGAEVVKADPLGADWLENTRAVAKLLAEALQ